MYAIKQIGRFFLGFSILPAICGICLLALHIPIIGDLLMIVGMIVAFIGCVLIGFICMDHQPPEDEDYQK